MSLPAYSTSYPQRGTGAAPQTTVPAPPTGSSAPASPSMRSKGGGIRGRRRAARHNLALPARDAALDFSSLASCSAMIFSDILRLATLSLLSMLSTVMAPCSINLFASEVTPHNFLI